MSKAKLNLYLQRTLIYTVLSLLVIIILFLLYTMVVNASRTHSEIMQGFSAFFGEYFGENFKALIENDFLDVTGALRNSFIVATLSAIFTTYVSALTAYAIHLYRFKGRNFIYGFILAVMMVPTQIASIGLVTLLYSINFVDNYFVLIAPGIAAPATFFFIKQYLDSVLHYEIIEASRVDGSSELKTFHRVVLPMIKPALAIQFIFSFVASWNNFFYPSLIIQSDYKRTVPLVIAQLSSSNPDTFDLGPIYMFMTLSILPMIIVFIIFSRQIIKGITLGSVKG